MLNIVANPLRSQPHQSSVVKLFIIDSSVPEFSDLLKALPENIAIAIVNSNQDGVQQLTDILSGYKNLTALHLVTHGSSGTLHLGNTDLNLNNIDHYAPQLHRWRQAFTENTELLLYSCELAADGGAFLTRLYQYLGVNLAASSQKVGNPQQGGTWNLDVRFGKITTPLPFNQEKLAGYQGILATYSASNVSQLKLAITSANSTIEDDIINLTPGTYTLTTVDNDTSDGFASTANGLPTPTDMTVGGKLTLNGNGAVIERDITAPSFRFFYVRSNTDLTINNLSFRNGKANKRGGAIYVSSTLGNLTVNNSVFTNNKVTGDGGYGGGAICIYYNSTATINNSTFSGNISEDNGGAINNIGALYVTNSTFTQNIADSNSTNSTFGYDSGGAIYNQSATTTLKNTLIAGNQDKSTNITTPDLGGSGWIDGGGNFIGNNSGVEATFPGSALVGTATTPLDAKLGPLADNGGLTQTHALLTGSPAINKGVDTNATGLTTDQRGTGFNRLVGTVDIGAFEYVPPEIEVLDATTNIVDGTTTAINFGNTILGGTLTKTFTVNNIGLGDLTLTNPLIITGTGFTGLGNFSTTKLAPSGSTTVDVSITANQIGTLTGELSFANNDSDENPFNFPIQLRAASAEITKVQAPPPILFKSGDNLDFVVTFSQPVTINKGTGIVNFPITLDTGGTVNATLVGTGTASTFHIFRYNIAQGNEDNNGVNVGTALTLTGGATVKDNAGNNVNLTLNNVTDTTKIKVDAVPPIITSIIRQNPTTATTNANTVVYQVNFSEAVKELDISDFILNKTGTANGTIASVSSPTGNTVTVTVNNVTGEGDLGLNTATNPTIKDNAGNNLTTAFNTGEVYTLDQIAPTVTVNKLPTQADPTVDNLINFVIDFSENVTGFDQNDITLSGTAGATTKTVTGSGKSYTVTVGGMTQNGTVKAVVEPNAASDAVGNLSTVSTSTNNIFTYEGITPIPTPTVTPTPIPTVLPTPIPTVLPTPIPTVSPTPIPTVLPTPIPTVLPTPIPTVLPTPIPTVLPTPIPTVLPTPIPTPIPQTGEEILNYIKGLTPEQLAAVSPQQLQVLTVEQTQSFIQGLTGQKLQAFAPQQIQNLIQKFRPEQIGVIYGNLTQEQLQGLTSEQILAFSQGLSLQQWQAVTPQLLTGLMQKLTPQQLQGFSTGLSTQQLQVVTPQHLQALIKGLNSEQLPAFLQGFTPQQLQGLTSEQLQVLFPTVTPIPTPVVPVPTPVPTPIPTVLPTPIPTVSPTPIPTVSPTPIPTVLPTPIPIPIPTVSPAPIPQTGEEILNYIKGLTPEQLAAVSPQQLQVLTVEQTQSFIQGLTGQKLQAFAPQQIQNLIQKFRPEQIGVIYGNLTQEQLQGLTSEQILAFSQGLSLQQWQAVTPQLLTGLMQKLTPQQLQGFSTGLSTQQLQVVTPQHLQALIKGLNSEQLPAFLQGFTPQPLQGLTSDQLQVLFPPTVLTTPIPTPVPTPTPVPIPTPVPTPIPTVLPTPEPTPEPNFGISTPTDSGISNVSTGTSNPINPVAVGILSPVGFPGPVGPLSEDFINSMSKKLGVSAQEFYQSGVVQAAINNYNFQYNAEIHLRRFSQQLYDNGLGNIDGFNNKVFTNIFKNAKSSQDEPVIPNSQISDLSQLGNTKSKLTQDVLTSSNLVPINVYSLPTKTIVSPQEKLDLSLLPTDGTPTVIPSKNGINDSIDVLIDYKKKGSEGDIPVLSTELTAPRVNYYVLNCNGAVVLPRETPQTVNLSNANSGTGIKVDLPGSVGAVVSSLDGEKLSIKNKNGLRISSLDGQTFSFSYSVVSPNVSPDYKNASRFPITNTFLVSSLKFDNFDYNMPVDPGIFSDSSDIFSYVIRSGMESGSSTGTENQNIVLLDSTDLPNSIFQIQDIDVALSVGEMEVIGDAKPNIVIGDELAQTMVLGEGNDQGDGGEGEDGISGGKGNDQLSGNQGNDKLYGDLGNDILYGGQGNDLLNGGDGDDHLYGDFGDDILIGGQGKDRFYIASNTGIDTINDFTQGQDLIGLTGGLIFEQLQITTVDGNAIIKLANTQQELAKLLGVNIPLTASDFFLG